VLAAKKESFRAKALKTYNSVIGRMAGENKGELPEGTPKFEEVFDETMSRKPLNEVRDDLEARRKRATRVYDPFMVAMFTVTGEKNVEKAEKALAGIEFKEEKL